MEQPKDLSRFDFLLHPLFNIEVSFSFYRAALKATGWLYGSKNRTHGVKHYWVHGGDQSGRERTDTVCAFDFLSYALL